MNSSQVTDRSKVRDLPSPEIVALILSSSALIVLFWGLLQLDVPLVRYVRSIHHLWLEQAGNIGNRLGSGAILVAISGTVLVAGLLLNRPALRAAGLESLIAHGIAGLLGQVLKHVVGRPRPRFVHSDGGFQLGPSWDTGLDSFPSGHATASFAVATVLARHFPGAGRAMYGLACLVALSRIVRGSHFPTDVMAGMMVGVLVGSVVINPIRAWKQSLVHAMIALAPYLVVMFALVWIAVHPSSDHLMSTLMVLTGVLAITTGMSVRLHRRLQPTYRYRMKWWPGFPEGNLLIGVGLALTTGSGLVVALAVLISLAHWLVQHSAERVVAAQHEIRTDPDRLGAPNYKALVAETPLLAMLPFAVWVIQNVKGLVPIL
jgi:membrane-associated phospholipid phosphatase